MWKRVLPWIIGDRLWTTVRRLNKLIPGYRIHETPDVDIYPTKKFWNDNQIDPISKKHYKNNMLLAAVLKNRLTNISFTSKEKKKGEEVLQSLGIPSGKKYICFWARDSAYLDTVQSSTDWSYHDYRDSSIHNYVPAAEEMANCEYYALRMGAVVNEKIHSSNPLVIDYASSGQRTDFSDIYLGSHCHFFLCSDGGISAIPELFRKPVVYANWTRINGLITASTIVSGLVIFKKYYLKKENRFLTFSETLDIVLGKRNTNEIVSGLNLQLIENTQEEISAVTIEMDERLNGTWETTEEDEKLQQRFWDLIGPDKLKSPDLRIGAEYLRDNQKLLK